MKFISSMVAAIAVFSTTVASLEPCKDADLLALMKSKEGSKCIADTNFLFNSLGFESDNDRYKAICSFQSCKVALKKLYEVMPNDCTTKEGTSFKSKTDPIYKVCFP